MQQSWVIIKEKGMEKWGRGEGIPASRDRSDRGEEKEGEGEEETKRQQRSEETETDRQRWEVGKARLLKGNIVNVSRRCSSWLQLRI